MEVRIGGGVWGREGGKASSKQAPAQTHTLGARTTPRTAGTPETWTEFVCLETGGCACDPGASTTPSSPSAPPCAAPAGGTVCCSPSPPPQPPADQATRWGTQGHCVPTAQRARLPIAVEQPALFNNAGGETSGSCRTHSKAGQGGGGQGVSCSARTGVRAPACTKVTAL